MTSRIGWPATLGLLLAAFPAEAQTVPRQGPPAAQPPAAGPNQAVAPLPGGLPRPPAPQPSQVPFQLNSQQQANLDWVLNTWQQRSEKVKTLECSFTRWEYDTVFGDPNKPSAIDEGQINYRAPDKGAFQVAKPKQRQERWICDGRSIYQYDYPHKQLIQHKLPPELQGKAIVESPLPFIFGAEAARLKQRYFLRIITPPDAQGQQTWLEAYPRFQRDAASFRRAELILTNKNMRPYALQIYAPDGQNRTVYQFRNVVVNDPLAIVRQSFHPLTPPFWKKVVEEAPAQQAGRRPGAVGRR